MSGNPYVLATCGPILCCTILLLPIHSASAVISVKGPQVVEIEILPTGPSLLQLHHPSFCYNNFTCPFSPEGQAIQRLLGIGYGGPQVSPSNKEEQTLVRWQLG